MPTSKTLNPGYRLLLLRLPADKAACSAALIAVGALLSGCQGIVNSPTASQVRIINASPDVPDLDIYQNNVALAYNLGFGTITSYVPIDPGTYTTTANSAGTKQVLSSNRATLVTATQYTILIGNVAANLQQLTLKDQSQPAPGGQIALRFIDQATRVNGLDAYLVPAGKKLTDVTPVTTNLTFNVNTGYLNVPAGTYTLVLVPTGTVPTSTTIATYTGAQVIYSQGSATTIILIDQQPVTAPGLQVLLVQDYVSPAATS